ncbi:unnamed protein product [Ectocarpus sp. 12 AP-2014]
MHTNFSYRAPVTSEGALEKGCLRAALSIFFFLHGHIRLFRTADHPFRDSAPFLEPFLELFPEPVRVLPIRDAPVQLSEVCFFLHPYITVDLPRTAPSTPLGYHTVLRIVPRTVTPSRVFPSRNASAHLLSDIFFCADASVRISDGAENKTGTDLLV